MISQPKDIKNCKECFSKSLKIEYLLKGNVGVFTAKCRGCGNYGPLVNVDLDENTKEYFEEQAEVAWSNDQEVV